MRPESLIMITISLARCPHRDFLQELFELWVRSEFPGPFFHLQSILALIDHTGLWDQQAVTKKLRQLITHIDCKNYYYSIYAKPFIAMRISLIEEINDSIGKTRIIQSPIHIGKIMAQRKKLFDKIRQRRFRQAKKDKDSFYML